MVSGKKLRCCFIGFVCLVLFMVLGSCRFPLRDRTVEPKTGLPAIELAQYADAVRIYNATDYENAAHRFEALREQTANIEMSRLALYGLACSRLMLADSPEQYQKALALWNIWVQCAPAPRQHETPVLFAPILKNKMVFSHIPLNTEGKNEYLDQNRRDWLLVRANQELQRMRKQFEEAGNSIDQRDEKIKALEKEVSRLNDQINAFEKIDQKIQKKKNAIPSAD